MEIERDFEISITFLEVRRDRLRDLLSMSPTSYVNVLLDREQTFYKVRAIAIFRST